MEKLIDARGLSCPQPVIITQKALADIEEGEVVTIVDNEIAKENVIKLAQSQGYKYKTEEVDQCYYINIYKESGFIDKGLMGEGLPLIYLITSNTMGKGSDELGDILIKGFFYAISQSEHKPKSVLFINSGVKLTTEGSEVIEYLMMLEKEGVEILSCGTCLDYFNLKNSLLCGSVSNMYAIVEKLNTGRVVTI